MPKVSVVLPTYNRRPLLREAVDSVVGQSFSDWELILVDDGSTDDTRAYFKELTDPRVSRVFLPHSANRSAVRNAGIARARGEWIAFLDSDDLWAPEKLTRQVEALAADSSKRWSCT